MEAWAPGLSSTCWASIHSPRRVATMSWAAHSLPSARHLRSTYYSLRGSCYSFYLLATAYHHSRRDGQPPGFPSERSYLLPLYGSLLTAHCSLLTAHCSPLTIHSLLYCSPLTTHHSPLTTSCTAHCSPLTTHHSLPLVLLTAHCSLLTTHHLLYCSLLTAHHSPLTTSCTAHCSLLTAH